MAGGCSEGGHRTRPKLQSCPPRRAATGWQADPLTLTGVASESGRKRRLKSQYGQARKDSKRQIVCAPRPIASEPCPLLPIARARPAVTEYRSRRHLKRGARIQSRRSSCSEGGGMGGREK